MKVLRELEQAGDAGLPTRKLCENALHSRGYGLRFLVQAKELGYIRRDENVKTGRPGHPWTMNYLTDKGRKLLQELNQ